jgi:hypothetical protein
LTRRPHFSTTPRHVKERVRAFIERFALDAAGMLAAIVYALPSLHYPFARDHGVHWYIGHRLLEGEMPYATSGVSTKPPAVFVVHALSQLFFGDHMSSIRVVDLVFVLATGVMIATFRTRIGPRAIATPSLRRGEIGACSMLVAVFHYTFFDFSDTAHPELWQAFFMLAPAWIIARAPDGKISGGAAFAAGALACWAVMFKHPAVFSGVIAGFAVVLVGFARKSWREGLANAGLYTAGVATTVLLTVLPFVLTGTFDQFWELMIDFIVNHYARGNAPIDGPPPWLTYDHGLFALAIAIAFYFAGLGAAIAMRSRRERWLGVWIGINAAVALGSVLLQRRALYSFTFTYYFVVMTPFMALMTAWGIRRYFPRHGAKQLALAAVLGALAFFYEPKGTHNAEWTFRTEWTGWIRVLEGRIGEDEHYRAYYNSHLDVFVRQRRVAEELNRLNRPGDTLCVDGFIPILYHLSSMRCPSRFIVGDGAWAGPPEWRVEYQTMLRENPPDFYVTFSDRPAKIRELQALGFQRYDVNDGGRPYYVIMKRTRT